MMSPGNRPRASSPQRAAHSSDAGWLAPAGPRAEEEGEAGGRQPGRRGWIDSPGPGGRPRDRLGHRLRKPPRSHNAPSRLPPPRSVKVLGIETSCDETGVAVYDTAAGLRAHALYSQVGLHEEYGGVVPELASRDHVRKLVPLVRE